MSGFENKIDIIIPYYNNKQFIKRTLDSIVSQKYYDIFNKIIIVDDGSESSHSKALNTLNIEKVKVIHKKRNEGSFLARLKGLEESTADFTMFLDSDDELSQNASEILMKRLSLDTEATLVFEMQSIYAQGVIDDDRLNGMEDFWSFEDMIEENVKFDPCVCNKMITKKTRERMLEIAHKVQFPIGIKLCFMEDVLWCGILISANPMFGYTPEIVYMYHRENDDSIMHGVRDTNPFRIFYSYIRPTGVLTENTKKFLETELRLAEKGKHE